jgi:ADP-heptose:LPS heptosyltransferase
MGTATQWVATCDAFVGIDSYFLHVADFARRPSVGIFVATSPAQWGFRFSPHARSLENATPDDVLRELHEVLKNARI